MSIPSLELILNTTKSGKIDSISIVVNSDRDHRRLELIVWTTKSGEIDSILIAVNSDRDHKRIHILAGLEWFIRMIQGFSIIKTYIVLIGVIVTLYTIATLSLLILALAGKLRTKKVCRSKGLIIIAIDIIAAVAKDSFTASIGFKTIILASNDPDHLWSSCRNFNEVKYELHLYKDDKSRVLFDKPIAWPVTQLVPTMDQMLAGPGIK